ncbi:lytic murein transglycosylase [Advenella alkanexedens]|uniref:Lytic murein transglycosylase n=1 Tax=Advenella alkanexedens TaxID=1481665 RepID=A0ABS6NJR2_9BURK|nr:lytic murein transglycosylase [Advenella alkanexedens]MBV4395873.1 lytic murein transglycosylase [Advenella alkanexedens]
MARYFPKKPAISRFGGLLSLIPLFFCASFPIQAQNTDFAACLDRLQPEAQKAGISASSFRQFTDSIVPDMSILEKLDYQPEFKQPIWDYLAALVDEQRIQEGLQNLRLHKNTLARIQEKYGVDPATVVAVWGVESNFGQTFGKYPLVQALGTLSCYGRRQAFFQKEFFAALRILQSGDITPERLVGSWAGAFGHTQFMPTTFERLAVDFDGDGHRDLMDNTEDALASTANYLAKNGWHSGQPWGFEVKLPDNLSIAGEGRKKKRTLQTWINKGLTDVNGQPLNKLAPTSMQAGLLTPAGVNGPAFLVFKNFDVIYSYNAAESYALAIAHLSDRLKGEGAFKKAWPTDDLGLSRSERITLQKILLQKSHDIGEADGLIGSKTREAIKVEQTRLGLQADGRAGQKILRALRQAN